MPALAATSTIFSIFMCLGDLNVGHGEYLLNNYVFKSGELSLIDKINYSRTIEKGKLFCKPLFSKNLKKLSVGSRALKRKNGRFLDEFSTLAAKVKTRKAKVASARLSFHSAASQRDAHGLIQRDHAADDRGDVRFPPWRSTLARTVPAGCRYSTRKNRRFHAFALRDGAGDAAAAARSPSQTEGACRRSYLDERVDAASFVDYVGKNDADATLRRTTYVRNVNTNVTTVRPPDVPEP